MNSIFFFARFNLYNFVEVSPIEAPANFYFFDSLKNDLLAKNCTKSSLLKDLEIPQST